MQVVIGKTLIDGEGQRQLRHALEGRVEKLKKQVNDDQKDHVSSNADELLETCKYLAALLDPENHEQTETQKRQLDAFEVVEGQTVEEALEGAEEEGARREKRIIIQALECALDHADYENADLYATSNRVLAIVSAAFQHYIEDGAQSGYLSAILHDEKRTVPCGVRAGGTPAFWIHVDPNTDFANLTSPTLIGEDLAEAARRVWGRSLASQAGTFQPMLCPSCEHPVKGDDGRCPGCGCELSTTWSAGEQQHEDDANQAAVEFADRPPEDVIEIEVNEKEPEPEELPASIV
ncbi:MAG: hypothetical protein ACRENP_27685 [Longimicrobiales bacterium]